MNKFFIKLIAVLLALTMFIPMTSVFATGITSSEQNNGNTGEIVPTENINGFDSSTYTESGSEFALLDNNYLSLYVSRKTGGFTILPSDYTFNAAKGQSYAVFKIGDYFYKFGYGRYTVSGTYSDVADVANVTVVANTEGNPVVIAQWICAGYIFYQKQTVVKETSMKSSYAVYTEYSLVKGDAEVSVTPYLTLDANYGEGPNDSDISRFMFSKTGVEMIEECAYPQVLDNIGDGDPSTDEPLLQDFDLVSARRAPYNEYFPLIYTDVTVPTKILMDNYYAERFDEASQTWVADMSNSRYYDDDFSLAEPEGNGQFMKDGLMQVFYPQTTAPARVESAPADDTSTLYAFVYGYSLLPDSRYGRESYYAPEVIYDTPEDMNKVELTEFGYLPWYGNYTFGYEWETSTKADKKTGISSIYSQYYLKADDYDMTDITTTLGIEPLTSDGYVTTERFNFGVQTKQINHTIFGTYTYYSMPVTPDDSVQNARDNDGRFIHEHMYMPNDYEQAIDPNYNQDRYKIHVVTAELFEITVVSDDAGRTLVPIAFSSCTCTADREASGDHATGHIYEIPSETLLDGKYYAPVGSTVYFAYMQSDDVSEGNGVGSVSATNATITTNYHYPDSTVNKEQYFSFTMPAEDVTLNVDFNGTADKMACRVINNSSLITCDMSTATEGERVNLLVDYNDLYASLEITPPEYYNSMNELLNTRKKDFIIKVSTLSGKNVAIYSNSQKHGFGISSPLYVFGGEGYVYQFGGRTKLVTHFIMPAEGVILSVQVFDRQEYSITAIGNNLVTAKVTQAGNKVVKSETDEILSLTIKRQVDSNGRKLDWLDFNDAKVLINGTELITISKRVYQDRDEIQYNFRMPAVNSVITIELKQDYKYLIYSNISFQVKNEDGVLFDNTVAPLEIMNPPIDKKVPVGYVMKCSIRCSPYNSSEFKGVTYNGVFKTVAELVANGQGDTPTYPCLIDTGYMCNGFPVYDYYFMTEADENNNTTIQAIGNFKAPLEIKMAYPDASYYTDITGFHVTGDFIPEGIVDTVAYIKENYSFAVEEVYQEFDETFKTFHSFSREFGMSAKDTGYFEIESATNNGTEDDIFIKFKNYSIITLSDQNPGFRIIYSTVRYIVTMADIKSSQVRNDMTSFSTSTNPSFAQGSNGALAIVQDYRMKDPITGNYRQTVVTAPSAEELQEYLAAEGRWISVIFTVIGEFERVVIGSKQSYIYKPGQTLTLNDTVSSYIPPEEGAYFKIEKIPVDVGYILDVTSAGCDLSIGSFTFFRPKKLENVYAGYRVIVKNDVDYSKEEAEISYNSYQNDVTLGVNVPGFVAELSGVKIKGDHIEFSGKLAILEPFTLAEINLEKLEFAYHDGDVSVLGLIANGYAGLGNIPFPFEIGGNAYAGIDTYKGEFYFDISLNLYFFETEARLYMKPLNSGFIFPDEIYFSVEVDPGIVIVPSTPVVSLNGGGGGVKDLVTSFNGSFDGIPPIMIEFFGSATIIELIGGKVGAKIGLGSFFLYGEDMTILEQEIVDYLELGIELKYGNSIIGGQEYCGFSLNGSGAISLEVTPEFPILVVSGDITLGVTVGRNVNDPTDSIFSLGFHGSLKGQLQIPEYGGIGPFNVISGEVYLSLDANAHFNTETPDIQGLFKRVSGNGKIGVVVEVVFWSIKIEYTFGADAPEISTGFFRRSVVPQVQYSENLYDDDGNYMGTFKSGDNIEFVSQSEDTSPTPMLRSVSYSLMSAPEPTVPTVTTGTAVSDTHTVSMPALVEAEARNYGYILTENAASSMNPLDFIKNFTVTKPDGSNYPINALPYAETYTQEQLADKSYNLMYIIDSNGIRTWYLSLTGEGGEWTIQTAEECALTVLKFNPLPELATANCEGNTITYTTSNISPDIEEGYEVRAYLGKDESGELGTLIGKGIISNGAGSLTISVNDETLSSGDYYVKLGLYELGQESMDINGNTIPAVDELIDIIMLEELYNYTNVNAPSDVTNVSGSYIGNGLISISFNKPDETSATANQKIKGYAVKLYEITGGDGWYNPYEYTDTDYSYILTADDTLSQKTISFTPTGVATGKKYLISIIPYSQITHTVDNESTTLNIYGSETISGSYIENRVPEIININIDAENGYVKSATQTSAEFVIGALTDKIEVVTNGNPTVSCLKTTYDSDNNPINTYEPIDLIYDNAENKYYISIAAVRTALGLAETAELTGFALSIKSEITFSGDWSTFYCNVTVDKTPPKLIVNSSTVTVSGNTYSIQGKTETGITVVDNYGNKAVSDTEKGNFTIHGTLSAAQLEAITNETKIGVFTVDKAGNSNMVQLSVSKRELKVGDIDILSAGSFSNDVFTYIYSENGNSGTVVFDPKTGTLKLSSLNLVSWNDFGIYTNSDLTLELDGTSTIAFCNTTVAAVVNVAGTLTVTGTGTLASHNGATINNTFIGTGEKLVIKSGTILVNNPSANTTEKPIIHTNGDFFQYGGEIGMQNTLGSYYAISTGAAKLYGGNINISSAYGGLLTEGELTVLGGAMNISTTNLPAVVAYKRNDIALSDAPVLIDVEGISEIKSNNSTVTVNSNTFTYITTFKNTGNVTLPSDDLTKIEGASKSVVIEVKTLASKIDSASLTLGADLTVNYFATVYETENNVQMRFTMNERSDIVDGVRDGETFDYQFDFTKIAPQLMGDNIKAELMVNGVVVDTKDNYSVKTYCSNLLSKSATDLRISEEKYNALHTLLSDLLEYGTQAQLYKEYKTDAPVNSGITEQSEFVTITESGKTVSEVAENTNNQKFTAVNLWFDNINRLCFKFTATDIMNVAVKIKRNNGIFENADYVLTDSSTGTYIVNTNDIKATGFDDVYTVELWNGSIKIQTLTYSVKSYIYAMQNSSNVNMANLAKATYNYGLSAKAYIYAE